MPSSKDFPLLRFPNPGSDIDNFINLFQVLYDEFKSHVSFSLDDMVTLMVGKNLATSSGYTGEEALKRSTNEDKSRDKFFNQAKSYSEMFRILGWIHPLGDSKQSFTFTYLGAHIAEDKRDPLGLVRESILGIAYPNQVVESKAGATLRPFALILRTMKALGGYIYRDEMIIGPLCMANDRDIAEFAAMIAMIKGLRGDFRRLVGAINAASTKRKITLVTMGNYTRIPISIMKKMGWVASVTLRDVYGRALVFLQLTDEGRRQADKLETMLDLRAADIDISIPAVQATLVNPETRAAVVRLGFYETLGRAGFELDAVSATVAADRAAASKFLATKGATPDTEILFSPFQELAPEYVQGLFPKIGGTAVSTGSAAVTAPPVLKHLPAKVAMEDAAEDVAAGAEAIEPRIVKMFRDAADATDGSLESVVNYIATAHQRDNQGVFYPLVAALFRCLGYDCRTSPAGVNARRSDAFITDPLHSIPIEIKSPGEETHLSVKAVRQAVENKVILLSRKAAQTTLDTTSLAIGFNPPNERSEVNGVINDVFKAFGIVVGVIDFRSLLTLVGARILHEKQHDKEALRKLHGIIEL